MSKKTIKTKSEIESLARLHTERAIQVLAGIMDQEQCEPTARIAAARVLLDRGYGRADQHSTNESTHRYVVNVPEKLPDTAAWTARYENRTDH